MQHEWFALSAYLQDNGQVVGVGVLVVVAVKSAAGFGAEVLFVRFEEPGRRENIRGNTRFEGFGDVKLVEKSPDTVVFVRATSAERCLVGKRKHEVGHAGEVVGRCGVHVAHDDNAGGRRGGEDGIDAGLEDGGCHIALPCRFGSAAELRGKVADKKVEGIGGGINANKSRIGKVGCGVVGILGMEGFGIGKDGALDVEDVAGGSRRQGDGYGFAMEKVEAGRIIQQGYVYAAFVGAFVMDVAVMVTA